MNGYWNRSRRRSAEPAKPRPIDLTAVYVPAEGPCPADVWGASRTVAQSPQDDRTGGSHTHIRESATGGLYLMRATVIGGWTFNPCVRKDPS